MMAAIPAVTKKVTRVTPMTLPAFFAPGMLAIAEAMEQNTMGTTAQNMRLVKIVPKGSSAGAACGNSKPVMQPPTMPISIHTRKP